MPVRYLPREGADFASAPAPGVLTIGEVFEGRVTSSILAKARYVDRKPIYMRTWRDRAILDARDLVNDRSWWIEVRDGTWIPPPGREYTILQRRKKSRRIKCPHPLVAALDEAIARTIASILKDLISLNVYGRPGPGGKDALAAIADTLYYHRRHPGKVYTFQTDIKGAFDSAKLETAYTGMEKLLLLADVLIHPQLRRLHWRLLQAGTGDLVGPWWDPSECLPTGAGSSPLLLCCLLHYLDNAMDDLAGKTGSRYARYGDDTIFQSVNPDVIHQAEQLIRTHVEDRGMTLHPTKTVTTTPTTPHHDYLGYRAITWPQPTLSIPPEVSDDWTTRLAQWTRRKSKDIYLRIDGWMRYYRMAFDLDHRLSQLLDKELDKKLERKRRSTFHQETWYRINGEEHEL